MNHELLAALTLQAFGFDNPEAEDTLLKVANNDHLKFAVVQAVIADIDDSIVTWRWQLNQARHSFQRAQAANIRWEMNFYTKEVNRWQRLIDLRARLDGLTEPNASEMLDDVLLGATSDDEVAQLSVHLHMALNDCNLWDTPSGKYEGHASRWVSWLRERAQTLALIHWIREHAHSLTDTPGDETQILWIREHAEEIADQLEAAKVEK